MLAGISGAGVEFWERGERQRYSIFPLGSDD
jgi:hypothetical protein